MFAHFVVRLRMSALSLMGYVRNHIDSIMTQGDVIYLVFASSTGLATAP